MTVSLESVIVNWKVQGEKLSLIHFQSEFQTSSLKHIIHEIPASKKLYM